MNDGFNIAAERVSIFFGRHQIQKIDVVSAAKDQDYDGWLRIKWKKAGAVHTDALVLPDDAIASMALAIVKGQSAEPILHFGEAGMKAAEPGADYHPRPSGFTAEL